MLLGVAALGGEVVAAEVENRHDRHDPRQALVLAHAEGHRAQGLQPERQPAQPVGCPRLRRRLQHTIVRGLQRRRALALVGCLGAI